MMRRDIVMHTPARVPGEGYFEARSGWAGVPGLIDLVGLFDVLWRGKWLILALALLGGAGGFAISKSIEPEFASETQVILDSREMRATGADGVMARIPLDDRTMASEVSVLRSRGMVAEVLEAYDLSRYDEFGADLLRKSTFREMLDQAKAAVGLDVTEEPSGYPSKAAVIDAVMDRLDVYQDGISYVMAAHFTTRDPELSAGFLNALAARYLDRQREQFRGETREAASMLEDHVENVRLDLRNAEAAVVRQREEMLSVQKGGMDAAVEQLSLMSEEAILARGERIALESKVNQIDALRAEGADSETIADLVSTPALEGLRTQRSLAQQALASDMRALNPTHPSVVQARSQLAVSQELIEEELPGQIELLRNDLRVARGREVLLEASIREQEDRIVRLSGSGIALGQLESEARAIRGVYESMLLRLNETRAQEALGQADAQVLTFAEPARYPVWPRPALLIAAGGFLAGLAALVLVFAREMTQGAFRSAEEVEETLGVAVIANISNSRMPRRDRALRDIVRDPHSIFAEQVRALKSAILVNRNRGTGGVCVMIGSSVRGEGKTTTALALAHLCAAAGTRTLLVDADIRSPSLTRAVRGARPSVVDFSSLVRGERIDRETWRDDQLGFDFIPCNLRSAAMADHLDSGDLDLALKELRERYDIIILDTSPVLSVSDSSILATMSDVVVFLVKEGGTPRRVVARGIAAVLGFGAASIGVVMTMGARSSQDFGYAAVRHHPHGDRDSSPSGDQAVVTSP